MSFVQFGRDINNVRGLLKVANSIFDAAKDDCEYQGLGSDLNRCMHTKSIYTPNSGRSFRRLCGLRACPLANKEQVYTENRKD